MSASTKISRLMKPFLTSTSSSKSFRTLIGLPPRGLRLLGQLASALAFGAERLVAGDHRNLLVVIPGIFARLRLLHAIDGEIVDDAPVGADMRGTTEEIDRELPHLGIDGPGFI